MGISAKNYIEDLIDRGYTKQEAYEEYSEFLSVLSEEGLPEVKAESFYRQVRRSFNEIGLDENRYNEADKDLLLKANDLARGKQRIQDQRRIEGKIFREDSRMINVLEKMNAELIDIIPKVKLEKFKPKKKEKKSNASFGIIQINDVHFNEIINQNELGNEYDFEIASARLKKLADKADMIFSSQGITHILITFLGDLLNSNRRLDEVLNASTNRAKATFLSSYILQQFLEDLLDKGYKITVNSVTGNESRAGEYNEFSDLSVTDNYDYSIHNILKVMFCKVKQIEFIAGDWKESLVSIDGFNMVLLHGEAIRGEKSIEQLISKWAKKGVVVNFVLHGHFHSALITDFSSRGGSLCGSNDYSDKGLNLYARASQNIHVVNKDKSVDSMKIDLQNVNREDGYNVIEELKAYNAKSSQKLHTPTTILEIRI